MATRTLNLPTSYTVAVSASEEYVATAGRNVVLASLLHRKRLFSVHPLSHPDSLAFSPAAGHLAVKNTLGEIAVLQVADGETVARFSPPKREEGPDVHYSPSGRELVHVTWSGKLRIHRAHDLGIEEERDFPQDMLFVLSVNATRELWLVGHRSGGAETHASKTSTRLSLWQWPLVQSIATYDLGSDYVLSAALSPCGRYIAVARKRPHPLRYELVLLSAELGHELAATPIDAGGTGSRLRWAHDSSRLGAVVANAFAVFGVPSLALETTLLYEYPSDMAFIESNRSLVLGTWKSGTVAQLSDA